MANEEGLPYPIQNPDELKRIASDICARMSGTDDGPAIGASAIGDYPPLYAAALGIMVAKLRGDAIEDQGEWLAKFLLALAQDRLRSVFDRSGEPHWPEWMEEAE